MDWLEYERYLRHERFNAMLLIMLLVTSNAIT